MFGWGEHQGIAAEGQLRQGPVEQAPPLEAAGPPINQQQVQIAVHAGIAAAVAAKHAHPLQFLELLELLVEIGVAGGTGHGLVQGLEFGLGSLDA